MFGVRGSGFGVQGSGFGVRGSGLGGEGRGARGEGAMQRVGRGTGLSHREIGEEMALPCLALIRRPPRTSALDMGGSGLCPCPVFDAGLTPRTPSPPPRQPGAPVVTPPGDLPPDIALSLRPPSPSPPAEQLEGRAGAATGGRRCRCSLRRRRSSWRAAPAEPLASPAVQLAPPALQLEGGAGGAAGGRRVKRFMTGGEQQLGEGRAGGKEGAMQRVGPE